MWKKQTKTKTKKPDCCVEEEPDEKTGTDCGVEEKPGNDCCVEEKPDTDCGVEENPETDCGVKAQRPIVV